MDESRIERKNLNDVLSSNELKDLFENIDKLRNEGFQNEFIYVMKKVTNKFEDKLQDKVDATLILSNLEKLSISTKNFFEIKNKETYDEVLKKISETAKKITKEEEEKIEKVKELYSREFKISNLNLEKSYSIELTEKISLERVKEINEQYPNINLSDEEQKIIETDLEGFIDKYTEQYNNKLKNDYIFRIESQNEVAENLFKEANLELEKFREELNVELFSEKDLKIEKIHSNFNGKIVILNRVKKYKKEQEDIEKKALKEQEHREREARWLEKETKIAIELKQKKQKNIGIGIGVIGAVILIYVVIASL